MNRSSISVIIPNYNRASLIADTISNMLNQSVPPDELIVVDDGSTDNSVEVIKSFGSRVKLLTQANQGPGAARNAGFRESTGDFIQFMDSDDLANSRKLEIQLDALQTTGADFAYGSWVRCTINEGRLCFIDDLMQAGPVPGEKPMLEWFIAGWSLVFQNCLFRRTALEAAGEYRTDLMPSEDSEYFIRILLSGAKPVFTPGSVVFYREHNINKITSTGTSSLQRANDWTNFLTVSGELVKGRLKEMRFGTLLSLASHVDSHLKFCVSNNLPTLPEDHPYKNLQIPLKNILVPLRKQYYRLKTKITGNNYTNPAYCRQPVTSKQLSMAAGIGYKASIQ